MQKMKFIMRSDVKARKVDQSALCSEHDSVWDTAGSMPGLNLNTI